MPFPRQEASEVGHSQAFSVLLSDDLAEGLLGDLEQLLRKHFQGLEGRLGCHLDRQEALLRRLADSAHCENGEDLQQISPRDDTVMGDLASPRRFVPEGVHAAPAADVQSASSAISSVSSALSRPPSETPAGDEDSQAANRGGAGRASQDNKLSTSGAANKKPIRGLLLDGCREPEPAKVAPPAAPILETQGSQAGARRSEGLGLASGAAPTLRSSQQTEGDVVTAQASNTGQPPIRKINSFTSNEDQLKQETLQHAKEQDAMSAMRKMTEQVYRSNRDLMHDILTHSYFEAFLCFLIISNTIFFGVEVQSQVESDTGETPQHFQIITHVYTLIFTLELAVRAMADCETFWKTFFSTWNCLDFFIVVSSIVEFILDAMALSGQNLSSLRVIRMARVARIVRVLRLMRFIRSLRILIHSVMNTVKSLFWTLLLLAMILYLFAILFTQGCSSFLHEHKNATEEEVSGDWPMVELVEEIRFYFGGVPNSVFTLFKVITGGVSWQEVSNPLSHVHFLWVALFVAYVCFTYLAVLNVVTGVFCQTAIESANYDQDMVVQEQLTSKSAYTQALNKIFRDIDDDNTGTITLSQFERRLKDPTLQAYFDAVGITIDEAWNLFKLLDTDESHCIDIDEFVSGCLRLRGNARTMDIAMLLYQSKWTMQRLTSITRLMNDQFEVIDNKLGGQSMSAKTKICVDNDPVVVDAQREAGEDEKETVQAETETVLAISNGVPNEKVQSTKSSWWALGHSGRAYEFSGL